MQRRGTMAAAVRKGADFAGSIAEEDDRVVADAAGERLPAGLIGPGGDLPGIAQKHRRAPSRRVRRIAGDDKPAPLPGKARHRQLAVGSKSSLSLHLQETSSRSLAHRFRCSHSS